jgi:serine/threonine-protein kinase PknK
MPTTPIRVVLAEDDMLLREGIASVLTEHGVDVLGQAGDATELRALVRYHSPDLVVVDLRMPPTHTTEGLVAAEEIRAERPDIGVLVLSAHVEVGHAITLLTGDRVGYLLKSRVSDVPDFIEALERIAAGESVVDPILVQELIPPSTRSGPLLELTAREREVLALMAEGRSNAAIARLLRVTEGTVEKDVHRTLAKLRLPDTGDDHRRVLAVITFLDST